MYYLPEDDSVSAPGLASFGAQWLGWDVEKGNSVPHLETDVDLSKVTATPRKYGFHGTLKPPFRLAEGRTLDGLFEAVERLAASVAASDIDALDVATIGSFLALVPTGGTDELAGLAARVVTELDGFRAPPSEAELARRRAAGLSARQDELLLAWGYPYVLDEFRFHLTLTGRLDASGLVAARGALAHLLPDLPRPFPITSISVAGERADGSFVALHRYALTG